MNAALPTPRAVGAVAPGDAPPRAAPWHGRARIAFARRPDGATALADLYQGVPLRVLRPRPLEEGVAEAVLSNVSGGLVGGDRLDIDVALGPGARALVTAQAAEKVYRSLGADVVARTTLSVAEGAVLEWLPQEAILFQGARLDRATRVDVAPGGVLVAGELLVFGRAARGERYTRGRVREAWRVSRGGQAVWADALLLDGAGLPALGHAAGLAGAGAVATFLYVADDAAARLELARALADAAPCRAAAGLVAGLLVVRFMDAEARRVRDGYAAFAAAFRAAALGRADRLPRVWAC